MMVESELIRASRARLRKERRNLLARAARYGRLEREWRVKREHAEIEAAQVERVISRLDGEVRHVSAQG